MSARRRLALGLVCAAVATLYVLSARRLPVGILNDDAANVLLARAILHGHYSFPGGVGAPEEFLPAFPAFLALPALLVAPHWDLLRAVSLAFCALALLLTWRLARRVLDPEAAAAATLLVALNPVLLGLGGLVMPYMPYLALSLALIDALPRAKTPRAFAWLTAGAALAPLLRPHGAVLAVFLALALWHERGAKRAAAFLACALLPITAWTLRNRFIAGASADYVGVWRAHLATGGQSGSAFGQANELLMQLFAEGLLCLSGGPWAARALCALAVIAAAGWGAARLLKRTSDPRVFVMAGYAACVLLLHFTWHWVSIRYIIPLVPIAWIFLASAASPLIARRKALAGALLALVLLPSLRFDIFLAAKGLSDPGRFEPRTMAWLREQTAPSAKVESVKNYSVSLLTGRVCLPQRITATGPQWLALAQGDGVDFVHVRFPLPGDEFPPTNMSPDFQPAFGRWLWTRSGAKEVLREPTEGTVVFRLAR